MKVPVETEQSARTGSPTNDSEGQADPSRVEHVETPSSTVSPADDELQATQEGRAEPELDESGEVAEEPQAAPKPEAIAEEPQAAPKPEEIDWKDRCMRMAADFDNYRKRTTAEASQARKAGAAAVMRDWLEVYDSTVRALQAEGDKDNEWFQGVVAMKRQMDALLTRHRIETIDTNGTKFDPQFHDALAVVPAAPEQDGLIIHTEQTGFVYEGGEVLRPARVVVGKHA